jgi:hypothetical protein
MERQPHAHEFQMQMMHEIEAARPKYVVHVKTNLSWLAWSQSDRTILNWFKEYQSKNLKLVGIVEREPAGDARFRWEEPGMRASKDSRTLMLVYRRRE